MRIWLFFLISFSAMADDYCFCNLYAVRPLASSRQVGELQLSKIKLEYYEDYSKDSRVQCIESCRVKALQELRLYKEDVELWSKGLITQNLHGKHCTGPTDVKIPVRAQAMLGNYSLGMAHQSIVFVHHENACKY